MQKLAKSAGVSPRTIYIKYEDKEDLLIKLFITEVLGAYEAAILKDFDEQMNFIEGVKKLWFNAFEYLKNNKPHFSLMLYGKSSPLLNKAYQRENIQQGHFFAPIHRFMEANVKAGVIRNLPFDVQRALLFSPLLELVNEYFDHADRPQQIITNEVVAECCDIVIKGLLKQ
jgi:AcrR family transcriptional regulator